MRNNTARPAKQITDQSLPTVCVSATVPRDAFEKFERIAAKHGLTKAAMLRKMILERADED